MTVIGKYEPSMLGMLAYDNNSFWRIGENGILDECVVVRVDCVSNLLSIVNRIIDKGYVSKFIDEEKGDHDALVAAVAEVKAGI